MKKERYMLSLFYFTLLKIVFICVKLEVGGLYMNENNLKNEEKLEETSKVNTPKRKSIFSFILVFLLGALVAVAVCVLIYTYKAKELPKEDDNTPKVEENENNNDAKEENQTNKELDLSLDGEFVKGLYEKIPVNIFSQAIYNYKRTTEAYLTGNQKMLFVLEKMRGNKQDTEVSTKEILNRLDQNRITNTSGEYISVADKFDVKSVEEKFKSVFGSNQNIIKEDIDTNLGYVYEYDATDACYYGHWYAGGGGAGSIYRTTIDSVEKSADGKEIYIYAYFIKAEVYLDNSNYQMTKESWQILKNDVSPIGNEDDFRPINANDYEEFLDNISEKYKDKLVKFKHTFVLDDNGNYYWYSCEPTSQI